MIFLSTGDGLIHLASQPWHWAFSGAMIALVLFLLTWMGRKFGLSSLYRNVCTIAGAGKRNSFFDIDIRDEYWRMAFAAGAIVGGFIAAHFLASPEPVQISEATIQHLHKWGIAYPQGQGYIAREILNFSPRGVLFALLGGFFIGFGARYGSGCTSGHAITGLSHLQLPSLITVIGFFIGGLTMTWVIMPLIFG